MFPLHVRTRRWICRTVFFTVGVLPMLGAFGWAKIVNSAGHLAGVRLRLAESLGLDVRLAKVSYPRPGVTLWEDLELADPETGATLASMRWLEISENEQLRTLVASQPVVDSAQAPRLWQLVENQLRGRANPSQKPWRLAAGELTLRWASGMQTVVDFDANLDCTVDAKEACAVFSLPGIGSTQPIKVHLERSNRSGQPATIVEFDNETAPLPCPLVALLLGRENHLGPHSTICGKAQANETPNGWEGDFSGRFQNVDLQAAISDQFPHKIGGAAELTIRHAQVHAGRLEECEGAVHAGPGFIGQSLLTAATQWLGMQRGDAANRNGTSLGNVEQYKVLAAAFKLSARGLVIRGLCEGQNGAIINSAEGVLLGDSQGIAVGVMALVRALVPDSRVQVPATRQTDWLLRALPIPDVMPRDLQAPPQASLHGGNDRR